MKRIGNGKTKVEDIEMPKVFWKYYDLYRRGKMSIDEYSVKASLSTTELRRYISAISNKSSTML